MAGILMWLMGVPLIVIVLLYLIFCYAQRVRGAARHFAHHGRALARPWNSPDLVLANLMPASARGETRAAPCGYSPRFSSSASSCGVTSPASSSALMHLSLIHISEPTRPY